MMSYDMTLVILMALLSAAVGFVVGIVSGALMDRHDRRLDASYERGRDEQVR